VARQRQVAGFFVPGRVEVLGKHTDYAGGRSLLMAAEKGFCVLAAPRTDARVVMLNVAGGDEVAFDICPELEPTVGHWSNYPMTVARRLARNFPGPIKGATIAFVSDLPLAAGMSSSSAMLVATFLALADVNRLAERDEYRCEIDDLESLAGYLGTVENGQSFGTLAGDKGVGTFGGSEDHTAILCCRAGSLSQYSYCPVQFERTVAVPDGFVFAIGASGVIAEKTGQAMAKYNRASGLARTVAEAWRQQTGRDDPHIAAALASAPDAADRLRDILRSGADGEYASADLLDRFEQFFAESERICPAAGDALAAGDLAELGRQVDRSQDLTERLLKNQVPETVFLAHSARECGAIAASAFGAGFGGSVWAMVEAARADAFVDAWSDRYRRAFEESAQRASFFLTHAGPAAFKL